MSVSYTSGKRKQESSYSNPRKSQKLITKHISTFTPAFWDSLSRVWLTRRALKEFDRRNRLHKALNQSSILQSDIHLLPSVTQEHLDDISQLAKNGGPDLTDLRGYPEPRHSIMQPGTRGPTNDGSASGTRLTLPTTTRTKNSEPRDQNFAQKLIDAGVFPVDVNLPGGAGRVPKPENFAVLQERKRRRRQSLSLTTFTDADYRAFYQRFKTSKTEKEVMDEVITMIEGTSQGRGLSSVDRPFQNFRPLAAEIVCGTPDKCYGANHADINSIVQRELRDLVVPSTKEDMPIAPNFFLEVKSAVGQIATAKRQALHTGVLGERGQIALRAWRQDGPGLDNMAHTISVTYLDGHIDMYCIHAERSRIQDNRTDYYMNRIGAYSITNDAKSFRKGVSAYRNLCDFAAEQRNISIAIANNMAERTDEAAE